MNLFDIVLVSGCIICCIVALLSKKICIHEWDYDSWPYNTSYWRKCRKCGKEQYNDHREGWTDWKYN